MLSVSGSPSPSWGDARGQSDARGGISPARSDISVSSTGSKTQTWRSFGHSDTESIRSEFSLPAEGSLSSMKNEENPVPNSPECPDLETTIKSFQCPMITDGSQCREEESSVDNVLQHMFHIHSKTILQPKPNLSLCCLVCSDKFTDFPSFTIHLQANHSINIESSNILLTKCTQKINEAEFDKERRNQLILKLKGKRKLDIEETETKDKKLNQLVQDNLALRKKLKQFKKHNEHLTNRLADAQSKEIDTLKMAQNMMDLSEDDDNDDDVQFPGPSSVSQQPPLAAEDSTNSGNRSKTERIATIEISDEDPENDVKFLKDTHPRFNKK